MLAAPPAAVAAPARTATPSARLRDSRRRAVTTIIQRLHEQTGGLSRVHHTHPALYAKARRAFGTWREAVAAAGLDYVRERRDSLRRGLSMRDQRRAAWRATAHFLATRPGAGLAELDDERPELARRVRRLWGDLDGARAWAEKNRERIKPGVTSGE
jgi:hypothetical protein